MISPGGSDGSGVDPFAMFDAGKKAFKAGLYDDAKRCFVTFAEVLKASLTKDGSTELLASREETLRNVLSLISDIEQLQSRHVQGVQPLSDITIRDDPEYLIDALCASAEFVYDVGSSRLDKVAGFERVKGALFELLIVPRQLEVTTPTDIVLVGPAGVGKTHLLGALAGTYGLGMFVVPVCALYRDVIDRTPSKMHELLEGIAQASSDALIQLDLNGTPEHHAMIQAWCEVVERVSTRRSVRLSLVITDTSPLTFSEATLELFDGRMVYMSLPQCSEREKMLRSHLSPKEISREAHLREIAHLMEGFASDEIVTYADLVKQEWSRSVEVHGRGFRMDQEGLLRILVNLEPCHSPFMQRQNQLWAAAYQPYCA
jgi:SpoVK/Ycf46/Vps4 family AAA+-type ATPase